jgi:hypothetical protein
MPVVEYVAVLLAAEPGSPNATKAWRSITDAIDSVKHSRSCLGYYICECVPLLLFWIQPASPAQQSCHVVPNHLSQSLFPNQSHRTMMPI